MSDNMKIWDAVCKTNPDNTKPVKFGRKFTTIDAHSQVQRATEIFGPFGLDWGVRHEEFDFLDSGLVVYTAILFYQTEGENSETLKGKTEIHSSILLLMNRRVENADACKFTSEEIIGSDEKYTYVRVVDDECMKKVATDALTKGLSKLGFNADVFLGKYDDNRYVARMKAEFAEQAKPKKPKGKPTDPISKQQWDNLLGLTGGKGMTKEEGIEMYKAYCLEYLGGIKPKEIKQLEASQMIENFEDIYKEHMKTGVEFTGGLAPLDNF